MGKVDELPAIQKFTTYMERYEKQVLPSLLQNSHTPLSPQKFVQIVINEVKKDSKLLNAFMSNPASMFASILAGAEIGLVPSDLLGEFFLIPRNLKGDDGQYRQTVTPLIGYKGMVNSGPRASSEPNHSFRNSIASFRRYCGNGSIKF